MCFCGHAVDPSATPPQARTETPHGSGVNSFCPFPGKKAVSKTLDVLLFSVRFRLVPSSQAG